MNYKNVNSFSIFYELGLYSEESIKGDRRADISDSIL